MFAELLGIVGPPALGTAINTASGLVNRIGEGEARRDAQKHEREMAETKEGREYLVQIHSIDAQGNESLFSRTMCQLYLMFGATMCVFILFSLFLQWEALSMGPDYALPFKDPDDSGKTIKFMGMVINWGTGRIQSISPLGYAYLGYATLSFIITLTTTNRSRFR